MEIKNFFYKNLHLKDGLVMEFTTEMMPEGALTSSTVNDAYHYFVGQAQLVTRQNRSRTVYIYICNTSSELLFWPPCS